MRRWAGAVRVCRRPPSFGVAAFVLIPGAGTDPRVYRVTIAHLRALDHDALAPPLPLEDPDAGPSDHAAAVGDESPAVP